MKIFIKNKYINKKKERGNVLGDDFFLSDWQQSAHSSQHHRNMREAFCKYKKTY
jgi:hypothetical protein